MRTKVQRALNPKYLAVLVFFFSLFLYLSFPSTTLIGDGLRHLPGLRTIEPGTPVTFEPKPWFEIYRTYYEVDVVHNHFLFALFARTGFAVSRLFSPNADAVLAMRIENAFAAAMTGALFFLLLLRLTNSWRIALVTTAALCFTSVYLLIATNIAEPGLALPFFVGALLVLSQNPSTPQLILLGAIAALAADTYLLAGAVVPGIAIALVELGPNSLWRRLARSLLFLSVFGVCFLGVWFGVLYASGLHSFQGLVLAVIRMPMQGTYGGLRPGSLLGTPIGIANSLFPLLPAGFVGLRSYFRESLGIALLVSGLSLLLALTIVVAVWRLWKSGDMKKPAVLATVVAFALIEFACFYWDPYYVKLQLFAVVLLLVLFAKAFGNGTFRFWLPVSGLFVFAIIASGSHQLILNRRPSLPDANARKLHNLVGEQLLLSGWASDVSHLWLYSNGENIISIADFALAHRLDSEVVQSDLKDLINRAGAKGQSVFFYGLLDPGYKNLSDVYETRFRLRGFAQFVSELRERSRPVARFEQVGSDDVLLYELPPPSR